MKKYLFLTLSVLGVLALTACEIPNPAPQQVIPPDWGADLQPNKRDIPYVANPHMGCVGWGDDSGCHGSQTLDIYNRALGGAKGTLVFVHGGGFRFGDKYPLDHMGVIRRLTHTGWSVVSVNYRLASKAEFRYPAAIQDVNAALRWVRVNGAANGLDTSRLVVAGHSAGGALAMLSGVGGNISASKFGEVPPLSGWVSIAGVTNFKSGPSSSHWGKTWIGTSNFEQLWWDASPEAWWDISDPKGYLVHGDLDTFVEYSNSRNFFDRTKDTQRVSFDSVDRWNNENPMSGDQRGHMPTYGMNGEEFNKWVDELPTLHSTANPRGSLDAVSVGVDGSVSVQGWAIDPDTPSPISVHVYVNGAFARSIRADSRRADVGRVFPLHGPDHGYVVPLSLPAGTHNICTYGINASIGNNNPLLGCRTISI